MKKNRDAYEFAEIEVISFEANDIISTSRPGDDDDNGWTKPDSSRSW